MAIGESNLFMSDHDPVQSLSKRVTVYFIKDNRRTSRRSLACVDVIPNTLSNLKALRVRRPGSISAISPSGQLTYDRRDIRWVYSFVWVFIVCMFL